jgi:hypothetical protein
VPAVAPAHSTALTEAPEGTFFFADAQQIFTVITRGDPGDPASPTTQFSQSVPPGSGGAILAQDIAILPLSSGHEAISQIYVLEVGPVGEEIVVTPPPMRIVLL